MQRYSVLVVLLTYFCCANALKCYICNSLSDPGCDSNPVPEKYLTNCALGRNNGTGPNAFRGVADAKVCWKQRQDVEGLIITDRMCGRTTKDLDSTTASTCYDRVGTKKIKVRYCVCNANDCNSSNRLSGGSAVLLTLSALAIRLTVRF